MNYPCAMPRIGANDHICSKSVYVAPKAAEPEAVAEEVKPAKTAKKTRKVSKDSDA